MNTSFRDRVSLAARALCLAVPLALACGPAMAVDGCRVLLCLTASNWRQIEACVPDVTRALWLVSHGYPMPACQQAGAGNYAQLDSSLYDPCPSGTTALASGATVIEGTAAMVAAGAVANNAPLATGIGDGSQVSSDNGMPQKVCVGNYLGTVAYGAGGDTGTQTVGVYDRVLLMDPRSNLAIDVYVNGTVQQRVNF